MRVITFLISLKRSLIFLPERSEFLYVKRDDFDRVLRDTVLKEWNEIKKSIKLFEYFDTWDDRYIQQSCMVSKMRYYDENAVLLSEDHGDKRYVYFLVDGSVDLLECVELKVTTFRKKKTYCLYNPFEMAPLLRGHSMTIDLGKILKDRLDPGKSLSDVKMREMQSRFSINSGEFRDSVSKSLFQLRESMLAMNKKKGKKIRKQSHKHSYAQTLNELTPAQRVN